MAFKKFKLRWFYFLLQLVFHFASTSSILILVFILTLEELDFKVSNSLRGRTISTTLSYSSPRQGQYSTSLTSHIYISIFSHDKSFRSTPLHLTRITDGNTSVLPSYNYNTSISWEFKPYSIMMDPWTLYIDISYHTSEFRLRGEGGEEIFQLFPSSFETGISFHFLLLPCFSNGNRCVCMNRYRNFFLCIYCIGIAVERGSCVGKCSTVCHWSFCYDFTVRKLEALNLRTSKLKWKALN